MSESCRCRYLIFIVKLFKLRFTGRSAVRLAHLLWEQGVAGSNPAAPTLIRQLAAGEVIRHNLAEGIDASQICCGDVENMSELEQGLEELMKAGDEGR